MLSSEHYLFETHQIPSSTCFLTWQFQIWFQFSKLKKSDSFIFSTLWMQVGFPTTWLVFQPPKWWDGWNSNHMWHKMLWELKWWQTFSRGKMLEMLAAMNFFGTEKPTSTDEPGSIISIGGTPKLKCQLLLERLPNNSFKHWSATRGSTRSLGAFPTTPTSSNRC